MRDPYRAIEVVALEVVSEAHDASIPSALARPRQIADTLLR